MLNQYLKKVFEITKQGDATEESYYSTLETLLKDYADSIGKKNIHITTLPKKTEAGNPDFRIWDGKQHIVGYIEAKAPSILDLDKIEESEQLKRYLHTFPNLILTNFFEFRFYRNGILDQKVLIGRPFLVHKLKTVPPVEKESEFFKLLEKFFIFSLPKVYDAKTLAIELAKRTRFLKDEVITQELKEEEKAGKSFVSGFYEAFRKYLIAGLTKEDFADLYSQTITYGLFAARTRTENTFNRKLAYDNIPQTIGILRDVFQFISLGKLPPQMEWIIDDISEVLAVTDVKNILHQYFHEGKGKDPIVHFYETFLAEYDPETREKRGVYYTPEPVVSYIVRSLHHILKEHFNRKDGFASDSVTVLDPAAGTLTFLAEAAKLAVKEFVSKYGEGGEQNLIREHILKNFYAFELMMAPYAVGHLKMSFLLEELGYTLQRDERFKLYLTNALETEELAQTELPGMASLSEESHLAGKVKKETPILVILGNPPYSIQAGTLTKSARELVERYKYINGTRIIEKGALQLEKNLQDDYVKFLAFAQRKIEKTSYGIIGFITNHGYLDNPTLRGLRNSLLETFDVIYIYDLHGSSKKREKCPDGSKDENVFDIKQGVSICFLIKKKGLRKKIYRSDLFGLREFKYNWLQSNNIDSTKWQEIHPGKGLYLFAKQNYRLKTQYDRFTKIAFIFNISGTGIVTAHDNFVIDFDSDILRNKFIRFKNSKCDEELLYELFMVRKKKGWSIVKAWKRLKDISEKEFDKYIKEITYRPFDNRYIFYEDTVIWTPVRKVMQHMMQENLGLLFTRPQSPKYEFSVFVSKGMIDQCVVGNKSAGAGISYIAPLYSYPVKENPQRQSSGSSMILFEPKIDYKTKKPNLSQAFIEQLIKVYKKSPSPEQTFFYIYATFYSSIYRTKYAEFLKFDFPRIPFTKDYKLFCKMADYGKRLVDLHLLKSIELEHLVAKFQGKGDNKVEKVRYEQNNIFINKKKYFENVSPEVWEYQIGGYQVCDKWLKDRKGRTLSLNEIKHYCKVITALQKTIEIQKAIDKIYPEIEKETIEFTPNEER